MDILGKLPSEISLQVLKYLSGEELVSCSGVSVKWRTLTNSNALWKRACLMQEIDLTQPIPPVTDGIGTLDPPCELKRLYYTHFSLLQKWRKNKFKTLDLENIIGTAYFENNTVLAVMYWDGNMEVFSLAGTPRVVQTIPALIPGGLLIFITRNEELVIFRCNMVFLVYKWFERTLEFWQALYASKNDWGDLEIRSTNSPYRVHSLSEVEDTFWDVKALMGDTVVLYVREDQTLYLWSLGESRCTSRVNYVRNPKCSVYEDHMFICNTDGISVYNVKGVWKFSLSIVRLGYHVRHIDMHFNEFIILGILNCSQGISFVKAWDWRWRERAELREKLHGLALHPRLPLVVYLSQHGRQRCACSIAMRDLLAGTLLWHTPFHTPQPFGTIYEDFVFFSIIKEDYLLCIPRYESSMTSNEQLLYNLKTGQQIYHTKNDYHFSVNYSNDKVIEGIVYRYPKVDWATRFILYN